MRYLAIKHHLDLDKEYWFELPESFADIPYSLEGHHVVCNTKYGARFGWVTREVDTENTDFQDIYGFQVPTQSILAVRVPIPMRVIKIPCTFAPPSPKKIEKRIKEYYTTQGFDTRVCFDSDKTLRDGYTAYLVSKMLGLNYLFGFLFAGSEVVDNIH